MDEKETQNRVHSGGHNSEGVMWGRDRFNCVVVSWNYRIGTLTNKGILRGEGFPVELQSLQLELGSCLVLTDNLCLDVFTRISGYEQPTLLALSPGRKFSK